MDYFTINDHLAIECKSERTRYGFRHVGELLYNGRTIARASRPYYNRTWERYEYESLFLELHDRADLPLDQSIAIWKWIRSDDRLAAALSGLRSVAAIATMSGLLAPDQKSKNDSQLRILRAGTGGALDVPADWSNLPEEEKARRLSGAIEQLTQ